MSSRGARWDALMKGEKRYISEKPCKLGHIGERVTATGTCIECRKLKSREKYASDPEGAVKKAQKYYQRHAQKIKAKRREKYQENPEKELVFARVRSAQWRADNPDKVKAQRPLKLAYKKKNQAKSNAHTAKRRTAKMQRTPSWLTRDDYWIIEQAYELAAKRTKMFGFSWHVDHVLPLQGREVSGLHVPQNLQVIPWIENLSKANKFDERRK